MLLWIRFLNPLCSVLLTGCRYIFVLPPPAAALTAATGSFMSSTRCSSRRCQWLASTAATLALTAALCRKESRGASGIGVLIGEEAATTAGRRALSPPAAEEETDDEEKEE